MKNLLAYIASQYNGEARENACAILSDIIEQHLSYDEKVLLINRLQSIKEGKHFDASTAKERISKMFYKTADEETICGAFISDRDCQRLFTEYRTKIPEYNVYDFAVVLNNTVADFHNLLYDWWENEEWNVMLFRFAEIAVNWLNDDDTPYRGEKAWRLLGND